ncbi:MAG: spore cortex biosynthesis protein YabQ [Clostridia bacterium]|nr:spore cortex biosynthesis protein YabQ [Clostridia bacterium]
MYGIDLSVQIENLMPALGLGFLLGFVYDCVHFMRILFPAGKIFLFVSDMLFVVFCTFSSFLLFLGVNNGNIRMYLVVAEITGAAVYFCTAGIIIITVYRKIAYVIKQTCNVIFGPFKFLIRKIFITAKKTYRKIYEILKKMKNKFKKPLKDADIMLYNNNN